MEEMGRNMGFIFQGKLDEHAREFYLAYKTYMYTVQKQMYDMRMKAEEEELRMLQDRRIGALKGELDWFMTEVLRLDDYLEGYGREIQRWKGRVEALDQERRLIESQVKTAKRQNKVLRATAERAQSCAESALFRLDAHRIKERNTSGSRLRSQKAISSSFARSSCSLPSALPNPPLREGQPSSAMRSTPSPARLHPSGASCPLLPPLQPSEKSSEHASQDSYLNEIKSLSALLAKGQQENRVLKASVAASDSRQSQLEELFLQCIGEAKQHMLKKDPASKATGKATAKATKSKDSVLQAMLENDNVVALLHERLFPYRNAVAGVLSRGERRS